MGGFRCECMDGWMDGSIYCWVKDIVSRALERSLHDFLYYFRYLGYQNNAHQ